MFEPGEVVDGRYDIAGTLGQGGMAQVFRAHDRHLEREVALKVLRPHLTESDSARFRREIQALAKLSHPGIVSIFDLGKGQTIYFAMELIEGGPFTDLGPLESDTEGFHALLEAAITVAETLGYVHHLGMVHRDLTPRNILLSSLGHPKVMDFGLVQLTETSKQLTRTGFTLGTPQYMAPEQAQGDVTGAHTDLYSFGAVLYRAATGVAPFDADNDQAVLYQHVYGDLTPPTELNPLIPSPLSRLISSLLQKEPGQRPISGYAVADTLRSILAVSARKTTHIPLAGPSRRGVYPHGPATPHMLQRKWRVKLQDGPQWPAGIASAASFLLIGSRNDQLVVLRPEDGGVHAIFEADDEVSTPPIFAHDRLYVTSRDGGLQAISWPEGKTLWRDSQANIVGLLPYGDGLISTNRTGEALHLDQNREPKWTYSADAPAATPPILHRSQVVFFTADGWLHSVDAKAGKGLYRVEVGGLVAAPPSAQRGILLLPERRGELHAFDMQKLEVLWSYDLAAELWTTPVAWQNLVFVATWGPRLHCLSLVTGDDVWSQTLPGPVTATPVLAAGTLYVATETGELLAFDARSGLHLWEDQVVHHPIQASPMPSDEGIVVATLNGVVAAYEG
jgi:serine/threonine-protein kinase